MSTAENTLNKVPSIKLTKKFWERQLMMAWNTRNAAQVSYLAVEGRPGCGKTQTLYQAIESYCKKHIHPDFEVIHMPSAALAVYDFVAMIPDVANGTLKEVVNERLLRACDPDFVGMVYFDEYTQMDTEAQKPLAKIVNERLLGSTHRLSPNCILMFAGNLATHKSGAREPLAMLTNRLRRIPVEADHDAVIDYFLDQDYSPLFPAYMEAFPDAFTEEITYGAGAFCSERSLEAVAVSWKAFDPEHTNNRAMNLTEVAGSIGIGRAREFLAFAEMVDKMPPLTEIALNPDTCRVPVKRDEQCAVSLMLALQVTAKSFGQFQVYVQRLPVSFQILFTKLILKDAANAAAIRKCPEFPPFVLRKEIKDAVLDRS